MAQTPNLQQSGICVSTENFEVISSSGGTSPENLPPLLRLISSKTSSVFDNYDRYIENHSDATFKQSSEVPSKVGLLVKMDQEEAFPRNFNTSQPSMLPRPSVSSRSIHSPHVISISLPSSPVNFQVDQAKRVSFRSEKIGRQTEISNSKISANQSFKIPEKRTRAKSSFYSQQICAGKEYAREMEKQRVPDISSGCEHDGDNREKGRNYAYFKTRSGPGPLEWQISHFHGETEAGGPEVCEIESLPAGRYFDALQGPELEILRVVRLNFFRGFRFSVAWWAYTFPMTGAAVATIEYCNKVRHPFTQALAVALSAISAFTVLSLLVSTILHAFVWGTLFPNDIAIAISNTKPRTRKRNKEGIADVKTAICCEIGTCKSQVHAHKKQLMVPVIPQL